MTTSRFFLISTLLASTAAGAQPQADDGFDHPVAPIHSAFELAIGGGYTQGVGATGNGMDVQDIAGPGGSGELQLGYRLTPSLALTAYTTASAFSAGNSLSEKMNDVGAMTAGTMATWHFRPARSVDPWLGVGGGVRWLAIDQNNSDTVKLRGLDVARLQVGIDYRVSPGFAISPMIGATATTFLQQDIGNGYRSTDHEVSWTFSGGVLGRFDAGI